MKGNLINFDYTKKKYTKKKQKSIQRRNDQIRNYKEIKEEANKNKTNVQKYFHNALTKECRQKYPQTQ